VTLFSSLYGTRLDEELGTDDSTVLFTTGRRKAGITRGIREFAELTECFQRWQTVTVVGGTGEYNLNSTTVVTDGDFIRLAATPVEYQHTNASSQVTILAGDDLPLVDVKWLDANEPGWRLSTVASSVSQMPSLYYLRPDGGNLYLGLWPPPSTGSSESAVVLVPYIALPPASTVGEPFTVNSSVRGDLRPFHQAAVHYAAHQLEKLRRDDRASDRQLQKFLGYVTRFLQNTRRKGGHVLVSAGNYFSRARNRGSWMQMDPRR
jgi:hypothetical protein